MRVDVNGGCHCGNIALRIELTREPDAYNPRACDCDFCRKHGASYVSDPQGSLLVEIADEREIGMYRQGSAIAECLVCKICGVLVGAFYRAEGHIYGTVNAKAVDAGTSFGAEQVVSPKRLSGGEKEDRWKRLWFPSVKIVNAAR
jgi:hypothetical protein